MPVSQILRRGKSRLFYFDFLESYLVGCCLNASTKSHSIRITGNATGDETVIGRQRFSVSAAVEVKKDISAKRRKTGCIECLRTAGHGFHLYDAKTTDDTIGKR